jgi:hypothetical protein
MARPFVVVLFTQLGTFQFLIPQSAFQPHTNCGRLRRPVSGCTRSMKTGRRFGHFRSKYLQAAALVGTAGPWFPVNLKNCAQASRRNVVPIVSPEALRFCRW